MTAQAQPTAGRPTVLGGGSVTYVPEHEVRPHVEVLLGPDGDAVTRDLDGPVPPGSDDHLHHKGLWWGHRDVDGADVWTEFAGHGRIGSADTPVVRGRAGAEELHHRTVWLDAEERPLLQDERIIRVHDPDAEGNRAIDIESIMTVRSRQVVLGDTKEAGLVAVRVAPGMEERRGGRIELATGETGEGDCWGRAADWCDYSGVVAGRLQGIAIFDHPGNPRRAHWHVRDYGLMAVNPFGLRDFLDDPSVDGSIDLAPGAPLRFRYRVLVHRGDARAARLDEHYRRYLDDRASES